MSSETALAKIDEEIMDVFQTNYKQLEIMNDHVKAQHERIRRRFIESPILQFLDENEHEWELLDRMCRARPWCKKKDTAFPFPFRKATQEMRDAGEKYWLGEDTNEPPPREVSNNREPDATPCPIITQVRPCKVFPPTHRLILFTPEFGSTESYAKDQWLKIPQADDTDIWIICWQGWLEFNEMKKDVLRWLLAFADGVSTVWFGHSFGALVAYECLRECVEKHECPNLPVALFVSGCPAPHLVKSDFRLDVSHPFLSKKMHRFSDYGCLEESEIKALRTHFSLDIDTINEDGWPMPSTVQRRTITGDLMVMRSYEFKDDEKKKLPLPLYVIRHDEDPLVPNESSIDAWKEYAKYDFGVLSLEEVDDTEVLASMGHGFAKSPSQALLTYLNEKMRKFQINKDVDSRSDKSSLPSLGDCSGDLPEYADVVIVGAGVTGAMSARAYAQQSGGKIKPVVIDKYHEAGGIWRYYANTYSRVNTSEVGYRVMSQSGEVVRPNQDHSPTHDILRDIYQTFADYAYGQLRLGWECTKCEKQADDTYLVHFANVDDKSKTRTIRTPAVQFCVNRRIGRRRDVTHTGEELFRGEIVYGYANEMRNLDFWGKRVLVVGAGAFAYENLRTSLEHGAKFCSILGRRAGTTCPKWIDMIAFIRKFDEFDQSDKAGNMISFQAWQKCFDDAGIPRPECWSEGLLKPHGHTISVSDLAYIGGFHDMVALLVGEIKHYRKDGQGVVLKDGTELDLDIVIKCTGFHLNTDVPKITGHSKMHGNSMLDYNLFYVAEPILDGGQFGSSKGMADSEHMLNKDVEAIFWKHTDKIPTLLKDMANMFQPRGNPFGSGYIGGGAVFADSLAWLTVHSDKQKQLMKYMGDASCDAVEFWASHQGKGQFEINKRLFVKLLQAKGLDSMNSLDTAADGE